MHIYNRERHHKMTSLPWWRGRLMTLVAWIGDIWPVETRVTVTECLVVVGARVSRTCLAIVVTHCALDLPRGTAWNHPKLENDFQSWVSFFLSLLDRICLIKGLFIFWKSEKSLVSCRKIFAWKGKKVKIGLFIPVFFSKGKTKKKAFPAWFQIEANLNQPLL